MRFAGRVAMLVALWLLAWGDVSVANALSGAAAAVALLAAFPPRRSVHGEVRLSAVGVARLAAYIAGQLGRSNLVMARQIIRPPAPAKPGVLLHRLEHPTEEVITVVSSIIALSPGTMTVDVAPDSSAIYVHFFHLDDLDGARESIARLERLAVGAIVRRSATDPTTVEEHR
jgi:multicomponent Na+:H+ antiporter subunit E